MFMTTVRSLLLHLLGSDKAKQRTKLCNKDDEDTFGNSKNAFSTVFGFFLMFLGHRVQHTRI